MALKQKVETDAMDPISTALASAAIKATAGPVAKFVKEFGVDTYNKVAVTFQGCFQGHVEATHTRCSKMKNILYRDQSVDFLTQYVNVEFSTPKIDSITDLQAVSDAISSERTLICGTAGAGKTMFMRWSALQLISGMKAHGRVPLFLEMRYFEEDYQKQPLEKYIYDKTSSKQDSANFKQFVQGLKSGLFIILLDAIDEINPRCRERVVSLVMDFMREYPDCGLVLSSRFDERLESIQDFKVLRSKPMNRTQIIEVIEKLEYDADVKSKLIAKLNDGLYNELDEFLSNPLLATIMLLTFDHSADIPTKLTAFYQQAFEALYQRHDAAKGAYKRAHHAGLPIDRFQNIFSTFSFQTYLSYKFEFSDTDLTAAIREACLYNQEDVDPDLLIRDSMESVCLIQREGLDNVFSHRSFQEYFCALFISRYRETDVGNLIEAIAAKETRSNVLRMLYELAPEAFEYEWVLPILTKYMKDYGRVRFNTKTGLAKAFKGLCGSLEVGVTSGKVELISWPARRIGVGNGPVGLWMSIMQSATQNKVPFYREIFTQPLWTDFNEFLKTLPDDIRPSEERIAESIDAARRDGEEPQISIYPEDAPWLIHSNLPKTFERLRTSVRSYHHEILERRNNRRSAVKGLLNDPRKRRSYLE